MDIVPIQLTRHTSDVPDYNPALVSTKLSCLVQDVHWREKLV